MRRTGVTIANEHTLLLEEFADGRTLEGGYHDFSHTRVDAQFCLAALGCLRGVTGDLERIQRGS